MKHYQLETQIPTLDRRYKGEDMLRKKEVKRLLKILEYLFGEWAEENLIIRLKIRWWRQWNKRLAT